MALLDVARRVKAGVCFLDKKIPNWRTVLRRHEEDFQFSDGEHCILGTLEHYSGRMRVLKAKKKAAMAREDNAFERASMALDIDGREHELGFDIGLSDEDDHETYDALWRAEFDKQCSR